jgi:hypothetical protein
MKVIFSTIVLFFAFFQAFAQPVELSWDKLLKIKWELKYEETLGFDISIPIFSEELKKYNGKEVIIKGYMVPADVNGNYLVMSAFAFASCFFCGGAGPESVIEIYFKKKMKFDADQIVKVKGILYLNEKDFYHLAYQIKNAQVIE